MCAFCQSGPELVPGVPVAGLAPTRVTSAPFPRHGAVGTDREAAATPAVEAAP